LAIVPVHLIGYKEALIGIIKNIHESAEKKRAHRENESAIEKGGNMPAHKGHTKDFEGLSYAEQAKSINATMAYATKAIKAHLRKAVSEKRNVDSVHKKCIGQVSRLLKRIEEIKIPNSNLVQ
jgi:hypothetical protein